MDLEIRLIDAAERLIERHGAQGFSLREAARLVKTDPAMVYRHFRDRADMVRAVADRGFQRLLTSMQKALQGSGPHWERQMRALGRAYVDFALDEPALFRLMFSPDRGRAIPVTEGPSPLGLLLGVLGTRASPMNAALCWAAVHGVAVLLLEGALERTQPVDSRALVELVLDAVVLQLRVPANVAGRRPPKRRR